MLDMQRAILPVVVKFIVILPGDSMRFQVPNFTVLFTSSMYADISRLNLLTAQVLHQSLHSEDSYAAAESQVSRCAGAVAL